MWEINREQFRSNLLHYMGGRTQADVSEKVGVHVTVLGKWVCGGGLPSLPNTLKLAAVLGCRVEDLTRGVLVWQ